MDYDLLRVVRGPLAAWIESHRGAPREEDARYMIDDEGFSRKPLDRGTHLWLTRELEYHVQVLNLEKGVWR